MAGTIEAARGITKISEDVVAIIAGLAATEVSGVVGMSGGVVGGIAELLGRKNLAKGVKANVGEKEAVIDLFLIVDFGVRIPDVALRVQESVKRAVEEMTGLRISEANVHIQGVILEKGEQKNEGQ